MTITAVMCTRNRTAMALQAMRCWELQTFQEKRLYIFDNSDRSDTLIRDEAKRLDAVYHFAGPQEPMRLNRVMNAAMNAGLKQFPTTSYLAKWDDDDLSNPNRMECLIKLAESTGMWVAGFNEIPFYDSTTGQVWVYRNTAQNYALGTSLLIGREAWKLQQFPETQSGMGSDTAFTYRMAEKGKIIGTTSLFGFSPAMVARLHGANTNTKLAGMKKATVPIKEAVLDMIAEHTTEGKNALTT